MTAACLLDKNPREYGLTDRDRSNTSDFKTHASAILNASVQLGHFPSTQLADEAKSVAEVVEEELKGIEEATNRKRGVI